MSAVLALVTTVAAHGAAAPLGPRLADRPPVERDCVRLEQARLGLLPRVDPRDRVPGAFDERLPNPDAAPLPPPWQRASAERLLCEQLNVKDKLDYLIRRLAR